MLNLECLTCKAKCAVDDGAAVRKFKCPRCGARIRRHEDGKLELLTAGVIPPEPVPAPAPPPAAPAPGLAVAALPPGAPLPDPAAAPLPEASVGQTGILAKFAKQDESQQNELVLWSVGVVLVLVVSGTGFLLKAPVLTVAPLAAGLVGALVALYLRARKRAFAAARAAVDQGKTSTGPDATDILPKVK